MNSAKIEFVAEMGKLLSMARSSVVSCELMYGKNVPRQNEYLASDDEYVVVACKNGNTYNINIDGNSLIGIVEDVFSRMEYYLR